MSATQLDLIAFYSGVDYWPVRGVPRRPRELNIPLVLYNLLENTTEEDFRANYLRNSRITLELDHGDCAELAPILLHESLFHFYKAFYNYLAARGLYAGGMLHWINITVYYARLYLARSLAVLSGHDIYNIMEDSRLFLPNLANSLKKKSEVTHYRLDLDLDLATKTGHVQFSHSRVNSHKEIWHAYRRAKVEGLGVYPLLSGLEGEGKKDPLSLPMDYLIRERNEENYSFDGYMQLDFNLAPSNFKDYFERDYMKRDVNRIYDETTSDFLLAFSTQMDLYRRLNVPSLPIEQSKFEYMITYCLPKGEAQRKLIELCREGFPTRNLHVDLDTEIFYDDQERAL